MLASIYRVTLMWSYNDILKYQTHFVILRYYLSTQLYGYIFCMCVNANT